MKLQNLHFRAIYKKEKYIYGLLLKKEIYNKTIYLIQDRKNISCFYEVSPNTIQIFNEKTNEYESLEV